MQNGTGKVVTVKSRRQTGKSMLIQNLLLYYSINFKKTKSACLSPTWNQAKKIFSEIVQAISESGIISSSNASDLIIKLINGSQLQFFSAQQGENLRGFTVSGILCIDEAAYISDDIFFKIKPWTDYHNAPILIVSTPFIRRGFFYENYIRGFDLDNYKTIDFQSPEFKEDMDKVLSPLKLILYKEIIPSNQFKSEYLGEWLDDDGLVFVGYNDCAEDNYINPNDRLFVGIDWGSGTGSDYTVISIINQDGKQVFLDYFNDLNTTQQIERLSTILLPLKKQIKVVQPETNGIGRPLTDLLKQTLGNGWNIKEFQTNNNNKNNLVKNLEVAFEQKTIKILTDEKQLRELGTYSCTINEKTKTISYNGVSGTHDDTCIALMLSYNAYLKENNNNYSFLFV